MDNKPVSQQFYENLVENSIDAKRVVSLERIKEACDALEKQAKSKTYTVADIGRYCERQWGGPKSQSIRNAPEVLEKYVKIRITEHSEGLSLTPNSSLKNRKALNFSDPSLAQQQYMLALAEIEQLKKTIFRLKADVDRYAPLTTDQLLVAAKNGGPNQTEIIAMPAVSIATVNALKSLFDVSKLGECELSFDKNGFLINDVTGNALLTASEVVALKTLISTNGSTSHVSCVEDAVTK